MTRLTISPACGTLLTMTTDDPGFQAPSSCLTRTVYTTLWTVDLDGHGRATVSIRAFGADFPVGCWSSRRDSPRKSGWEFYDEGIKLPGRVMLELAKAILLLEKEMG